MTDQILLRFSRQKRLSHKKQARNILADGLESLETLYMVHVNCTFYARSNNVNLLNQLY